ncbi:MAG: 6,7-dimethyl-8-ribityllumazine synthase [Chloroflexi bacterium]|nr:6,7-dimethyl-8-ribityllumazine synthase [Chloroflexota bacterium]
MAKIYEGSLVGRGLRLALVASRFNRIVGQSLLEGARDSLVRHGVAEGNIDTAWVPGAFELPLVARRLAQTGNYSAVVCLGAIIRGQTPHFDYLAAEVTKGIAQVGLETGVPVSYGVVTADTLEQAIDRAGAKAGNKGADAATSALEMANLLAQLEARPRRRGRRPRAAEAPPTP